VRSEAGGYSSTGSSERWERWVAFRMVIRIPFYVVFGFKSIEIKSAGIPRSRYLVLRSPSTQLPFSDIMQHNRPSTAVENSALVKY
jgi:hypothetical protein